ncbi:TlyA family rRNA (cytidine-2'-O)-methyltransferase [soil metagenome]
MPVTRPAALVAPDAPIALEPAVTRFVSRGGDKLDGALHRFSVTVAGRRWLDAGASTGGFTDRLLQGGARAVAAVDVGYGQLDWRLRNDERVVVLERTNVRNLTPEQLPWEPEAVVADLSFISLRLVLPALTSVARPDADHILMVKPQFEVGRREAVPRGVVRDPQTWRSTILSVVEAAASLGLGLVDAVVAAPRGPAGNREFFVHLKPGWAGNREAVSRAVEGVGE